MVAVVSNLLGATAVVGEVGPPADDSDSSMVRNNHEMPRYLLVQTNREVYQLHARFVAASPRWWAGAGLEPATSSVAATPNEPIARGGLTGRQSRAAILEGVVPCRPSSARSG